MNTKNFKIALVIFLAFVNSIHSSGQTKSNLSGIWIAKSGTIDNPGEAYFKFVHNGDSLFTTISLPMYGDKFMNMPLQPLVLKNDTIRFLGFDGVYLPDKDQIVANINFLYEAVPFTLSRTEVIGSPVIDTAQITNIQPVWIFDAKGRTWSSPIIHDRKLIFGCDDSVLYTLNTSNGQLIRKFRTEGKIRGKVAISGKKVVFTSDDGFLYCLNSKTGDVIWKSRIHDGHYLRKDPSYTETSWDYALSSPVISKESIFIGSVDSCFYKLDLQTGKILWKFKTDHIIRATPQIAGQLAYVGNWSGKFYAIDTSTGKQVWIADLHQPILSQPAIENNHVITGSRHAWLWCLDAQTGSEIWKYNYWWSWVESSPVIEEGIIYIGSSDLRRISAIDLVTGKTKWNFRTTGYPYAAACLDKSSIYMGSIEFNPDGKTSGFLYTLDKKTGKLNQKIDIPISNSGFMDGIFGDIAVDNDLFYSVSLGGKVMAFRKSRN